MLHDVIGGYQAIYLKMGNPILQLAKARFRRRSTYVPNLTDELSTAKERRLN